MLKMNHYYKTLTEQLLQAKGYILSPHPQAPPVVFNNLTPARYIKRFRAQTDADKVQIAR